MTNPSNIIGTPAAFDGRTGVKAYNDLTQSFTRGIISGWACAPKSGMTVNVGGSAGTRDVAVAEDASGNRTTINNRLGTPAAVTIATAPSANSRIDLIVAYVQPSPTGDGSTTDNPDACGIIAVAGVAAASPVAPDDAAIRAAITTDGGTGASAYYAILAQISVGANVSTIGSGVITQGTKSFNAIPSVVANTQDFTGTMTTTNTSLVSTTVPASGTYIVTAFARAAATDSTTFICDIYAGATQLTTGVDSTIDRGGTLRAQNTIIWSGDLTEGDTLDLRGRMGAGTATTSRPVTITATRIA